MSRRTRARNAFQSNLTSLVTAGATSFAIDSAAGLDDPCYLVISPTDPAKREYIKVGVISGTNLQSVTRNLAGSVGAVEHQAGEPIRSIITHQHLDDLFDDVEDLEAFVAGHAAGTDLSDHPEATTSVRGFLSAADKTKLDGLGAGGTVTGGNAHDHNGGDGAQISHANLSNLTAGDPHTQYALETAVWSFVYPVGSIYISTVATNPNTLFGGGTWAAFGTGRFLVGIDAGQTEFDTVEETGGAKTHDHTIAHTHQVDPPSTVSGISNDDGLNVNLLDSGGQELAFEAHDHNLNIAAFTSGASSAANSGSAVGLPPYIVCYMWKRTA